MLSCREVAQRLASSDGDSVGFWGRLQVRMHLLMCRHCQRYERDLQAIGRAVRQLYERSWPSSESAARVQARVLEPLDLHDPEK